MKKKKQILLDAIQNEDWKTALSIAKGFKYDFNKEQQKTLQHAYAFIIGQSVGFFEALNIDMQSEFEKGLEILYEYSMRYKKIDKFYVNKKEFKRKVMERLYKEWGFKDTDDI